MALSPHHKIKCPHVPTTKPVLLLRKAEGSKDDTARSGTHLAALQIVPMLGKKPLRDTPKQATVATAHNIARVVYHLLKAHEAFEKTTALAYDQHCHERELKYLQRKAAKMGML